MELLGEQGDYRLKEAYHNRHNMICMYTAYLREIRGQIRRGIRTTASHQASASLPSDSTRANSTVLHTRAKLKLEIHERYTWELRNCTAAQPF